MHAGVQHGQPPETPCHGDGVHAAGRLHYSKPGVMPSIGDSVAARQTQPKPRPRVSHNSSAIVASRARTTVGLA
jgi:hypothetical protein